MKLKNFAILLLLMLALLATACEKEGTAEKAGKALDKMVDSAKDKIKDATK